MGRRWLSSVGCGHVGFSGVLGCVHTRNLKQLDLIMLYIAYLPNVKQISKDPRPCVHMMNECLIWPSRIAYHLCPLTIIRY